MPLCFGASGSVRARQTPQSRLLRGRRPHLLPGELPAAFCPNSFRAQRREVRAGARLAEQLAPDHVAAQRGRARTARSAPACRPRGSSAAAHQPITRSGRLDAGGRQLLVDEQLLGRRRPRGRTAWASAAPAARCSASATCRFSTGSAATSATAAAISGRRCATDVEVDVQLAAHPVAGQCRDAAQPARPAAEELRDAVGAAQVQVRVVLPGDADAAEHLDAVLGVGLGRLDADGRGDARPRSTAGRRRRRRPRPSASAAATAACCERSSISAHMCLMAWKLPIGLPNCSRTLAYSVAVSSAHRASPAASAASTVAARSSNRRRDAASRVAGADVERDPGQRTGEVGGLQRLDRHTVSRRRRPPATWSPTGSSSSPAASAPST